MKTIEEMIATHTKEEWREFINKEMEELGLEFVEGTEFDKRCLFDSDYYERNDTNEC